MKFSISVLAVSGLTIIAKADDWACYNNPEYTYGNDPSLTCQTIRRQEPLRQLYCQSKEVHQYCPQTCGTCCEDNPVYKFNTPNKNKQKNGQADCEWLGMKDVRKKYCKVTKGKRRVQNMCPVACDLCQELVPIVESTFPTSSEPTAVVTPSPTQFPSSSEPTVITDFPTSSAPTITCVDDPLFSTSDVSSCKYVRNDPARREFYCGTDPLVRESCPLACGDCCADDISFTFKNKKGRKTLDCARIARTGKTQWCTKYARDIATAEGSNVKAKCPKTCNFCFDYVVQQP